MAEQYTPIGDFTRIMPDGETVIVDRESEWGRFTPLED
jgi:hypothetical protein